MGMAGKICYVKNMVYRRRFSRNTYLLTSWLEQVGDTVNSLRIIRDEAKRGIRQLVARRGEVNWRVQLGKSSQEGPGKTSWSSNLFASCSSLDSYIVCDSRRTSPFEKSRSIRVAEVLYVSSNVFDRGNAAVRLLGNIFLRVFLKQECLDDHYPRIGQRWRHILNLQRLKSLVQRVVGAYGVETLFLPSCWRGFLRWLGLEEKRSRIMALTITLPQVCGSLGCVWTP
jgi:hypothetical protein